jgi:hypothetical protein
LRLEQHAKQEDFWTHAAVFTSKDQNLTKAHVKYLGARLVLADLLLCLPIVGVNVWEKTKALGSKSRDLILKAKGIEARGQDAAEGFVVRAGSQAVKDEVPSIHACLSEVRRALVAQGVLEDVGTVYRLTQDYTFNSPSTAAGVLLGRSANGRQEWKDLRGRTLKEIQEASSTS